MTSAFVTLGKIGEAARAETGGTIPVFDPVPLASELVAAGASSQVGAVVVPDFTDAFWQVVALDGDVFVAFGSSPDAGSEPRWLVPAGATYAWGATSGHRCAVKARS